MRSEVESIVIELAAQRARQALDRGTMGKELGGDLRELDPYELAEQILNGHTKEPAD